MTIGLSIKKICEKDRTTQLQEFPILLNKTREEFIEKMPIGTDEIFRMLCQIQKIFMRFYERHL